MKKQLLGFLMVAITLSVNATTYTVTSTGDAGTGSSNSGDLRYCITQLNASGGVTNNIDFAIAAAGVQTITIGSSLPAITKQVTINGYSQPGAVIGTLAGRTILIQIVVQGTVPYCFRIQSSNSVICGLNIITLTSGNSGSVAIDHDPNTIDVTGNVWIWGNYFGTNAAGTATYANQGGYAFNIYGNTSGAGAVSTLNNWIIGTNGDGAADANEGNLFSQPDPVLGVNAFIEPMRFFNCDNFVIAGNMMGLHKNGTTPLQTFSNTVGLNYGISITNCVGFRIGTNGDAVSDVLERNVIAGMRSTAIVIFGNKAGGEYFPGNLPYTNRPQGNHLIYGNYIGTDATGMAVGTDLQNRNGIQVRGSRYNTIGSATNAALRNVIVNNGKLGGTAGVYIYGENLGAGGDFTSEYNTVAGNYIGVLADGVTASSNLTGIRINTNGNLTTGSVSSYKNTIDRNIIANNTARGIDIRPNATNPALVYDNTITQNSIYANTGLGINLGNGSGDAVVTPNDGVLNAPSTVTANRMMDYGVIKTAALSGNNLSISGFIGNTPAGTTAFGNGAIVEFFIADNSPADQNGNKIAGDGLSIAHGEGKTYLGSLTANANGLFSGTLDVTGKGFVAGTSYITNTATEVAATGSTSEFGANVTPLLISGHVYDDANGNNNSFVDGIGTNAGGLNAVLYDNTTGQVIAVAAVSAAGTYNFTGAVSSSNYTVYLTTATATIGQTTVPAITLPTNWEKTGEKNCVNTAGCSGDDGNVNGILPLGILTTDITQANFGIEQLPQTFNQAQSIAYPAGGIVTEGKITTAVSGSDAEDGVLGNSGTIRITQLPANAAMYYNGSPVSVNDVITGFNPALLSYTGISIGSTSVVFNYAFIDAANLQDPSPATYTVFWTTPLPVTLTDFSGQIKNTSVQLNWRTSMEINIAYFEVERSVDGSNFTLLQKQNASGSANGSSYQQLDVQPYNGISYYRLKIMDQNGVYQYSKIVVIRYSNAATASITVSPNPFTDKITVKAMIATDGTALLRITDAGGKQLYKKQVSVTTGTNNIYVDGLGRLAPGIYVLQLKTVQQVIQYKLIKM